MPCIALQKAELVETLQENGQLHCIIAPTNSAFEKTVNRIQILQQRITSTPDLAKVLHNIMLFPGISYAADLRQMNDAAYK